MVGPPADLGVIELAKLAAQPRVVVAQEGVERGLRAEALRLLALDVHRALHRIGLPTGRAVPGPGLLEQVAVQVLVELLVRDDDDLGVAINVP